MTKPKLRTVELILLSIYSTIFSGNWFTINNILLAAGYVEDPNVGEFSGIVISKWLKHLNTFLSFGGWGLLQGGN